MDLLTGAGVEATLEGAAIVVDVSKPSTLGQDEMDTFFHAATANLLRAERSLGIRHHVCLSIVGSDRPHGIPFYRGKAAAEQIVRDSGTPFSIVHATQFFEFASAIAASADREGTVTLPDALVQPAAGRDVADAIVDVALAAPTWSDAESPVRSARASPSSSPRCCAPMATTGRSSCPPTDATSTAH